MDHDQLEGRWWPTPAIDKTYHALGTIRDYSSSRPVNSCKLQGHWSFHFDSKGIYRVSCWPNCTCMPSHKNSHIVEDLIWCHAGVDVVCVGWVKPENYGCLRGAAYSNSIGWMGWLHRREQEQVQCDGCIVNPVVCWWTNHRLWRRRCETQARSDFIRKWTIQASNLADKKTRTQQ